MAKKISNNDSWTIAKIKISFPELYAECVDLGVRQERERISLLLSAFSAHPVEQYALNCIRGGSPINNRIKARYGVLSLKAARDARRLKAGCGMWLIR